IATVTLNPSLDEWMSLPALRAGELNRATGFARYPGGKGINVSRVVRELGERTVALALAGGEDGEILRRLMNRLSIPHDFVAVEGTTRNNYKIRTARPRALTEINTEGPRASRSVLRRLEERLLRRRPPPQCVVLSGSLPPGSPPGIYRRWIRILERRGIPTILDSSGAALAEGLRARPWLIKPNRFEAGELLGARLRRLADVAEAAKRLVARGPSLAVISLGPDGAVLASRMSDRVLMATPPTVPVDSAVGAGDSLVAGFVVGWRRTRSLHEALRLGVACGTAAAMTPGTELCHRADVQRVKPRVRLWTAP
ncbi:MAG: 1-phosphofructokinase, partial [Candidatus Omnitrophica bacterium]|nr:1-phosphofructokinase [Candidatus Omnitrophota bacterium]